MRETTGDYVKTFITDNMCNGRLGCQMIRKPDLLTFDVEKTDKIKRNIFIDVKVSEHDIKFIKVYGKKKYSEDDVLGIVKSVAAVVEDYLFSKTGCTDGEPKIKQLAYADNDTAQYADAPTMMSAT